jgi:hypothetical protein
MIAIKKNKATLKPAGDDPNLRGKTMLANGKFSAAPAQKARFGNRCLAITKASWSMSTPVTSSDSVTPKFTSSVPALHPRSSIRIDASFRAGHKTKAVAKAKYAFSSVDFAVIRVQQERSITRLSLALDFPYVIHWSAQGRADHDM